MDNYNETFETWNKVALLYQEKFMDLTLYNESYDKFCNSISKVDANILEIGCGPGNITKYLLSKRPDFNIYGIDFAPSMIKLATKNNPTAKFDILDCRNISQLQMKFNGIICGFCLPYLSKADGLKLLSDSHNLLEESGILYLSLVEGNPADSGFKISSTGDRTYFYYYELEKLLLKIEGLGFSESKIIRVNYMRNENESELHTIIITKKVKLL